MEVLVDECDTFTLVHMFREYIDIRATLRNLLSRRTIMNVRRVNMALMEMFPVVSTGCKGYTNWSLVKIVEYDYVELLHLYMHTTYRLRCSEMIRSKLQEVRDDWLEENDMFGSLCHHIFPGQGKCGSYNIPCGKDCKHCFVNACVEFKSISILAWMCGTLRADISARIMNYVAEYGSVDMLSDLHEKGYICGYDIVVDLIKKEEEWKKRKEWKNGKNGKNEKQDIVYPDRIYNNIIFLISRHIYDDRNIFQMTTVSGLLLYIAEHVKVKKYTSANIDCLHKTAMEVCIKYKLYKLHDSSCIIRIQELAIERGHTRAMKLLQRNGTELDKSLISRVDIYRFPGLVKVIIES